ncbi:MAG: radical SAM protein [Clostridiales bacterium]|nr:radical SAM protein [Clostridiales bacterium]
MKEVFLLVRPYYGVNIHTDAQGEYGTVLHSNDVFPDLPLINAATILNQSEDHDVIVLDAYAENKMLPDTLLKTIASMSCDKIVIKTTAASVRSDIELVRRIKMSSPDSYVIVSGQVVSDLEDWLKANSAADQIVTEPLDKYIYRYVNHRNGTVNDMPTPDYSLVNYRAYTDDNGRVRLTIQASRSCPMHCTYCPYTKYYGAYESRDVDKVMEDIRSLVSLGAEIIQFRDQFFTCDKEKVKQICQKMIDEGIKVSWICETKINSIDEELAKLMKKAGLILVCFGVESGNKEILETYNSNKGDIDTQKRIVKMLKDKGILTMAFYIIGFPEDTWETVHATYRCAEEIDSDIVAFNEYTTFYFDGKENIDPGIFRPFENSTNVDTDCNLSRDEIRYAIDLISAMYTANHDCLEKSYTFNHKIMSEYRKNIAMIAGCVEDLQLMSDRLRQIR